MSTVKYEIEFFSHWHCGSGQAAGADVDALAIKDDQGLPYVPGKTIKGLLREAATILCIEQKLIDKVFGVSGEKPNHSSGETFFGNATLPNVERGFIIQEGLSDYLYQSFSSTAIDDQGIAIGKSLRKVETVVPCKLEGEIINLPDGQTYEKLLVDSMKYVKRMGTGRNRGFGRCQFSAIKFEKEETK